jgi:hypothetical protein
VYRIGPYPNRNYRRRLDAGFGGRERDHTLSAGQRRVDDLLVSHRLHHRNLGAKISFAVADYLQMVWTHTDYDPIYR